MKLFNSVNNVPTLIPTLMTSIMPKALELRKVIKIVGRFGIGYVTGKGRHPKFFDPQTKRSYPIKAHGKKTMILPYALSDIIRQVRSTR